MPTNAIAESSKTERMGDSFHGEAPEKQKTIPIVRRTIGYLKVYDVWDLELAILERGFAHSIYLSLALAMLSTSISLGFSRSWPPLGLLGIAALGGFGVFLLAVGLRSHYEGQRVIREIRKRGAS